jgi:hypothetical protein
MQSQVWQSTRWYRPERDRDGTAYSFRPSLVRHLIQDAAPAAISIARMERGFSAVISTVMTNLTE